MALQESVCNHGTVIRIHEVRILQLSKGSKLSKGSGVFEIIKGSGRSSETMTNRSAQTKKTMTRILRPHGTPWSPGSFWATMLLDGRL